MKRSASIYIMTAIVVAMAGCASLSNDQSPEANNRNSANTSQVVFWETIDGGTQGNAVIGVDHVRFVRPVAVAARGNFIYVVDAGKDLVYRYARDFGTLTVLKDLRSVVAGEVRDIYVDGDLSFYITDTDGGRVLHFDPDGNLVQVFEDKRNLARPVSIIVDETSGLIYIADGFNDDVMIFNRLGALQGAIGARGTDEGEFTNIQAIASGPDGIYVACRLGHRVQEMSRDGDYIKSFEANTVTFPLAIVVDRDKRAFVADYLDNTIKVYADGRLIDRLGGSGSTPGRFKRITGMWLDEGQLYVADSLNGRIQVARVMPLNDSQVNSP